MLMTIDSSRGMRPISISFFGHGDFGAAGRLGKDSFGAREQLDPFENFFVGDALAPATRLAHGLNDIITVGGIADGDRAGDRIRLTGVTRSVPCAAR